MKIGEFARLGQVSVRMLRHYESLGLLAPHETDRFSGHRSYEVAQLAQLNRIMALNSLGIPLKQVAEFVNTGLSTTELVDMLKLRRHQLVAEQASAAAALADVEFRLALIERSTMEHPDCIIKELPAERILGTTVVLGDPPFDTSVIGPLFEQVAHEISRSGGAATIGVGLYTDTDSGTEVTCGYRSAESRDHSDARRETADTELAVTELPSCTAATLIHEGSMSGIGASWQNLAEWCLSQGQTLKGPCREIYLETGADDGTGESGWVVELQQPITQ